MNFQVRRWRLVVCLLVLEFIVAAAPLPCGAQQAGQAARSPGIKASIQPAVRASVATKRAAAKKAQEGTDPKAHLGSTSFFKSGPGIAVLAIVGAGAGYAIYSASHDRIHSSVPNALK